MKPVSLSKRLLSSSLVLLALTSCGGPDDENNADAGTPDAGMSDAGTQPAACDQAAYDAANEDSAYSKQSELSNQLFAISASNARVVWKDAEKTTLRVAVWTTFGGYTNDASGKYTFTRDVFVTPAPQVQELCKSTSLTGNERSNRINQYLGLPAEATNARRIVELWVKASDLYRPCPDSEITDTTCDLTYPSTATDAHKTWLNNYFAGSHNPWVATKYPFTGMGYTYDWCSGTASKVGASEYIVKSGAVSEVIGYKSADEYCAK